MTPRHTFTLVLLRFTPELLNITEHYCAICLMGAERSTNVLSDHVATSQCSTRGNVTRAHVPRTNIFFPLFLEVGLIQFRSSANLTQRRPPTLTTQYPHKLLWPHKP